jgi:mannitol-1-phosphate 5-dehydrogenase
MSCGLLGYLLNRSGYRTCFITRRQEKLDAINNHDGYRLFITGGTCREIAIRNCEAVLLTDHRSVGDVLAGADVVMTGVGIENLTQVAPLIAAGLWRRSQTWGANSLNVIACENLPGAGEFLRHKIVSAATYDQALAVDAVGGFGAALTRRIMVGDEPQGELRFTLSGEPDLMVDSQRLRAPFPALFGTCYTAEFASLLKRKLFTLNCAQAVAAYLGHQAGCTYLHEAVAHPLVEPVVRGALAEACAALEHEYPEQAGDIARDGDAVLTEIADPALRDRIVRVARDPRRKLSSAERLIGPARLAHRQGLPYGNLCIGIAAALAYDDPADAEAVALQAAIADEGLDKILAVECGLLPSGPIARVVKERWFGLVHRQVTLPASFRWEVPA